MMGKEKNYAYPYSNKKYVCMLMNTVNVNLGHILPLKAGVYVYLYENARYSVS